MKITLWISALTLALGASASSARANGESLPTRDPGMRDCSAPFASAMNDDCQRWSVTPPPPPSQPDRRTVGTSECPGAEYTLQLTARELFPEWVMLIDRMRVDEGRWRIELASIVQQRQAAANDVYRLFDYANDPRYSAQYNNALYWRDALAGRETMVRRKLTELSNFRAQKEAFMARVGTQTVRMKGCLSKRAAINHVRSQFNAPPL